MIVTYNVRKIKYLYRIYKIIIVSAAASSYT